MIISDDAGVTWSEPFRMRQAGRPLEGTSVVILRLADGRLGMVYGKEVGESSGVRTRSFLFATSTDDGKNWSGGSPIDAPLAYSPETGTYMGVRRSSVVV